METKKTKLTLSHDVRERFFGEKKNVTFLGVFVLVTVVAFGIASPAFTTKDNIMSILRQAATIGMLACGQTIVLLMGGIDLSQASLASLVSITSTMVMTSYGVVPGIIAGLLTGLVLGLIMGVIVTKGGVQPFVVTIGMQFSCLGLAYILSNGQVVYNLPSKFLFIGTGMVGPFPFAVLLVAVIAVCLHILLSKSVLGRSIYAVGGNIRAAHLSGIAIDKVKITAWIINGLLVATGGLILTARVNSGQPELAGNIYLMQSIASAVIGGTSLSGGKGGIPGTIFGVLFICILNNGLNILGIDQFTRQIIMGAIIIFSLSRIRRAKRKTK